MRKPGEGEKKRKPIAFLAEKAKRLAVPRDFQNVNERRRGEMRNGKDLGTVYPLVVTHKKKLRNLLSAFIQEHKWREAAGVLSVLLPILSMKGDIYDNRQKFYFWSAMEVLRQLESPTENMLRIRRLFNLLRAHTHKGRKFESIRCGNDLELALYLTNQDDLDAAYSLSRIVVDASPFRDDPAVHLFHGLILHKLWYKKMMEEIKMDSGNVENLYGNRSGDLMERTGENVGGYFLKKDHTSNVGLLSDVSSIISDDFASQHTNLSMGGENSELLERIIFESSTFFHNDYDEDKGSLMEEGDEEFLEMITIQSSPGLDARLFPLRLSSKKNNSPYIVPMKKSILQDIHDRAVKNLKFALLGARDMPLALLPLVQLLLAVGDVKGAYHEIEDCCKASKAVLPVSLKALLLDAVVPRSASRLWNCYKEIVRRNPSSVGAIEALLNLHSRGAYDLVSLIESLSEYLDVNEGITAVWYKFSVCLLAIKTEQEKREQKQASPCLEDNSYPFDRELHGSQGNLGAVIKRLKEMFVHRKDQWSRKHFSTVELKKGDKHQVTYKAACATHLYGPNLPFVMGLYDLLKKEGENDLLELLKLHLQRPLLLLQQIVVEERL